MAAELPRPGVEIIQEFRSVSPTVIAPTLVPCIVGVGKQIVDLLVSGGSGSSVLNSEALVSLQGFFVAKAAVGDPAVYGGLDGLKLDVSFNNGPTISTEFADPDAVGLTPASVVAQLQKAFDLAGVTAGRPTLVGDGDTQWKMATIGVGEFQFIDIKSTTDAAVASAFGIGIGRRYQGLTNYNQLQVEVPQIAFPDPRGNLAELSIENDTIRAFIGLGAGGFIEALRTSAFLRKGEVDDSAVVQGTVDLTTLTLPGDLVGETLTLKTNQGALQTVDFNTPGPTPTTPALVASYIQAQATGLTAVVDSNDFLVLTSVNGGDDAYLEIVGGTAAAILGLAVGEEQGVSIQAVDDGNGDPFTSLVKMTGEDFTATPTAAVLDGVGGSYPLAADGTLVLNGGDQNQTINLATGDTVAQVFAKINAVVAPAAGGYITGSNNGGQLRLTHSRTGTDSVINIVGGTALAALGLSVGSTRGVASKPEPGDVLWIDGALIGEISEVAPGGAVDTLKVSLQQTISSNIGRYFFIQAMNLPSSDASRPTADLVVDLNGSVHVKQEVLRDIAGEPVSTQGPLYISYTAVRLDVSPKASSPGLLRFDDTTQLESVLSPINAENPLALGLFFALLNAPGVQITGAGVDEISADSPFGTVEGFTRTAEFLEGFEVYAIAPLTHDNTVHQVYSVHATAMSAPDAKGERVAIVNPSLPTNKLDTLVASGTDGSTVGSGGLSFDTGIANLSALVLGKGITPTGVIATSKGLFLDIGSDAKNYSISGITGSVVTIRKTFSPGENDDSFYSTTDLNDSPLPSALVDEAFSVKVRGASLVTATGLDKNGIAETVAGLANGYKNRRLWMTVPDKCGATLEGSEQLIDGFYMNAAIAGMIGQNPPQQSFTNFPIAGFTRVIGSNDTFSERQLNVMAGGGAWIIIQESQGAPLTSRFAITSDLTSVETRTDSITKVVDFTAKFLRRSLKNFIGRFNITQGFLDTLGSVIQGVGGTLVENGVLLGFTLNNIIQDENSPDTVLIDVTLDVPFPANFIRLTLVI